MGDSAFSVLSLVNKVITSAIALSLPGLALNSFIEASIKLFILLRSMAGICLGALGIVITLLRLALTPTISPGASAVFIYVQLIVMIHH